jgi:hypothetical protein
MCTDICSQLEVRGSLKGRAGWTDLNAVLVSYDHPVHADEEHAVLLDLLPAGDGHAERVAVELTRPAARALATGLLKVAEAGDSYEGSRRI